MGFSLTALLASPRAAPPAGEPSSPAAQFPPELEGPRRTGTEKDRVRSALAGLEGA